MSDRTPWPCWQRLSRWLTAGLYVGVPLVGLGCRDRAFVVQAPPPTPPRPPMAQVTTEGAIRTVSHIEPPAPAPAPVSAPTPASNESPKEMPITLDTVLRLAEQHNPRIALARERLHESQVTFENGANGWLPNTYAGIAYYRHEGGIQQFDGRLTHSSTGAIYPGLQIQSELDLREGVFTLIDLERRICQNKAELSQVNNEILVEAATTYIDLLSARRGEAIALELNDLEKKLLDRTEKLAKTERAYDALLASLQATTNSRQQAIARFRQQGNAASAKLVYLLGLAPGTCLVPVDHVLAPVELVDASTPACDLVARVLATGPGVKELESLISLANLALAKTYGHANMLPSIQLNLCEGPFGAGPGSTLAWDNRLDVGLQVRWNLTSLAQTDQKREVIRSRQMQAMLNFDELKGKLAAGVTESRDAILFGREQIGLAASQIRHASESYRLSERRMQEGLGPTPGDVLLNVRNLEQAHFNLLQSIAGHNKAQVRLLMLVGPGPEPARKMAPGALPVTPTELPAPKKSEEPKNAPKEEKPREALAPEPLPRLTLYPE